MAQLQIVRITDIHTQDAWYFKNPIGHFFIIYDNSVVCPSKEEGFTSLQKVEAVSEEFKEVTCFYAVKYEVLYDVKP